MYFSIFDELKIKLPQASGVSASLARRYQEVNWFLSVLMSKRTVLLLFLVMTGFMTLLGYELKKVDNKLWLLHTDFYPQ